MRNRLYDALLQFHEEVLKEVWNDNEDRDKFTTRKSFEITSHHLLQAGLLVGLVSVVFLLAKRRHEECKKHENLRSRDCTNCAKLAAIKRQKEAIFAAAQQQPNNQPPKTNKARMPEPERFLPKLAPPKQTATATALRLLQGVNYPVPISRERSSGHQDEVGFINRGSAALRVRMLENVAKQCYKNAELAMANNRPQQRIVIAFDDGKTKFLNIPYLPKSEYANILLKRLAREFLPIVRQRGYHLLSVSEMCCCTESVNSKLGMDRNMIEGFYEEDCDGFCSHEGHNGQTAHFIEIRLREERNHYNFLNYSYISDTMAHELAHCIHRNHGHAFWKLYEEIKLEHQQFVAYGFAAANQSSDEQFGFDIYGASRSRI